MLRGFLIFFLSLNLSLAVAQEKKPIQILGAKVLESDIKKGEKVKKLAGNVRLKQDSILMTCDSAWFYDKLNMVEAFGSVHIFDEAGNDLFADSLTYRGNDKTAECFGNVRMISPDLQVVTNYLLYNTGSKTGTYVNGGRLFNKSMNLISTRGMYNSLTDWAYFKDSVVLTTDEYRVESDTLNYKVDTEIAWFFGYTTIRSDDNLITCYSGMYDTKNDISSFGRNTTLKGDGQTLLTDSLYYNQVSGDGKTFYSFVWNDSSADVLMSGKSSIFNSKTEYLRGWDSTLLIYLLDKDSLFLTADTLISFKDNDSIRHLTAWQHVRYYKTDLQGVCDTMFFSFRDSIIRMFQNPVIWNEHTQLTGDTIYITLGAKDIKKVELIKNGFIINQTYPGLYNQVKGKYVEGYFKDEKLHVLYVKGNAETIYYAQNDNDEFLGVNKAISASLTMQFMGNAVQKVSFFRKPEATYFPIQKIKPADMLLKNFNWQDSLRPTSKSDLFHPRFSKSEEWKGKERKSEKLKTSSSP